MTHDEYFQELKEWSRRKLNIIQKYLDGFSRILGYALEESVYYVDGFAGRGIYDMGEKGSPVLAAEMAERLQDEGKPYNLYCINIEENSDNYANLQSETARFGNLVQNHSGTFSDKLDIILREVTDTSALFFLDDFGVKGTEWNAVERVISRKHPTDLWIRFDHITVRRLAGFAGSDAKDAPDKFSLLPQLFGINNRDYLLQRLGGPTPGVRIMNAVSLYLECLESSFQKFGKKGFAAAYPISSLDGKRKYHLVFACSHPLAATLASNIVNGEEENFQIEMQEYLESKRHQLSLFPMEPTQEEIFSDKVSRLKDKIVLLSKKQPLKRTYLHYKLLCYDKNLFGKIGRKHLTQALKELLNENPPRIVCNGTPGSDQATITLI